MDCSTLGFLVLLLSPTLCSNSCPLSQCCHPIISSVFPFSSCLQSFPESGSFTMSHFFPSDGQSIGASTSASVLPMDIHSGLISFRIDWFDLLAVQVTLNSLLQYHSFCKWHYFILFLWLSCVLFLSIHLSMDNYVASISELL